MLQHLSIQNYALIRHLEIDFSEGLSVITGETGAGKSILLGALDLILGKRADTRVLLDKSSKCYVEGTFQIGNYGLKALFESYDLDHDNATTISREINTSGKSRAFINDTPVKLNILKEIGEKLIDIHSQHQNLALSESDFQTAIVDNYAGITAQVRSFQIKYRNCMNLKRELQELKVAESKSKTEKDYFEFLSRELSEATIKKGEQNDIESELKILENAEEIKSVLYQSKQSLENGSGGVLNELSGINSSLAKISQLNPEFKELADRINSTYIELSDLLKEIERNEDLVNVDPSRASELNDRLNTLYALQQKHRVNTEEDLLNVGKQINDKLKSILNLESDISKTENKLNQHWKELCLVADEISKKRQNVFQKLQNEILSSLKKLGMADADFSVHHNMLEEPGPDGQDAIRFLFNANKGGVAEDISRVASGGEKSRLMLAIKSLISMKNLLPTIIFDEIDTGVSGAVADKVGDILQKLSSSMQVIVITHLPQIAGKGKDHFLVYKNTTDSSTFTNIKRLDPEERTNEIAKLLSGREVTTASVESAKNLLNN